MHITKSPSSGKKTAGEIAIEPIAPRRFPGRHISKGA
jgi:hypothetical protein